MKPFAMQLDNHGRNQSSEAIDATSDAASLHAVQRWRPALLKGCSNLLAANAEELTEWYAPRRAWSVSA